MPPTLLKMFCAGIQGTWLKCCWQLTRFWNRAVDSSNGALGKHFKRPHFGVIFYFSCIIIATVLINQCAFRRMAKLNLCYLHWKCHFN